MKRFLWLSLFLASIAGASTVTSFTLKSSDGLARLNGEIDYPAAPGKPVPLVVMVPGTGLFDRDALFGNSGTDRDFVFRDLARAFNAQGIAVARYDYRGVRCNARTMPPCATCRTSEDLQKHYFASCVDATVRRTVTPENMRDDIADIYRYAAARPGIDPARVALFGHSEGTIHAAHLAAGRLAPVSLVLMGAITESPKSLIHWQITGRFLRIFAWDADQDGKLTNEEIRRGYGADPWFRHLGFPVDALLSPSGSWTRASLGDTLERNYQAAAADALSTNDTDPYPKPATGATYVQASYRWWKMFFLDDEPVARRLAHFRGRVILHNGTLDSQTPGDREFDFLRPLLKLFAIAPRLRLHKGVGHGMSRHPLMGPLEETIRDAIARDLAVSLAPAR